MTGVDAEPLQYKLSALKFGRLRVGELNITRVEVRRVSGKDVKIRDLIRNNIMIFIVRTLLETAVSAHLVWRQAGGRCSASFPRY